jgi:hypothetical protein
VELAGSLMRRIEAHLAGRGIGTDLREMATKTGASNYPVTG